MGLACGPIVAAVVERAGLFGPVRLPVSIPSQEVQWTAEWPGEIFAGPLPIWATCTLVQIPAWVPVKSNDNVTEAGSFYQKIMLPACLLLSLISGDLAGALDRTCF